MNKTVLPFASVIALFVVTISAFLLADGPRDNLPDQVRPVPPPGIKVPASDQAELETGLAKLGTEIEALLKNLQKQPALPELLPDVEIFHKAVRYALTGNESFKVGI